MGAFDLASTMDGIAALLDGANLVPNNYAWPVESVSVPCSVVGYPTTLNFDVTFQRGGDLAVLPVWFLVGKSGTKDARDGLSAFLTAVPSIKSTLDGDQSFGDVRVTDADVTEVAVADITYLALKVNVEVIT